MRKEKQIGPKQKLNLLLLNFLSLKIKNVLVKISLPCCLKLFILQGAGGRLRAGIGRVQSENQLFYDLPTPFPFICPKMALSLKAFPLNNSPQF